MTYSCHVLMMLAVIAPCQGLKRESELWVMRLDGKLRLTGR